MADIIYGDYTFSSPIPFVGIEEEPIFLSGQIDHTKLSITLEGELTGCDLPSIKSQKEELVSGFSSGFSSLTIGSTGYDYVKPISINFQSSPIRRRLPYSISLEAFHEKDFSQFYGIESPVDIWQYQEQEGRRVGATHTVSARGVKTSATDSLTAARNFVNGRLNDFENISLFFSGDSVIKTSSEESINQATNSYSVVESYDLSTSLNSDKSGVIVRPSSQIVYDIESFSISVNGSIEGGITGAIVDTGYFSPDDATAFAKDSVNRTKIEYEDDLYGEILRGPLTYNYDIDTGANRIDFSFDFGDPTDFRTGDVIHDYSTSFEASKDNGYISATINGEVKYNSTKDIFTGQAPEEEVRFQKVQEEFSGISPFALLQQHYSYFQDLNLAYSNSDLNDNFVSLNIEKSPHQSSITYNYNYTNKIDLFSGILREPSLTVETTYPIPNFTVKETVDNSFSVQETFDSLKRVIVNLNGKISDGSTIADATSFFDSFVSQYSGQSSIVNVDSVNTGDNSISLRRGFVITDE